MELYLLQVSACAGETEYWLLGAGKHKLPWLHSAMKPTELNCEEA